MGDCNQMISDRGIEDYNTCAIWPFDLMCARYNLAAQSCHQSLGPHISGGCLSGK